MQSYQSLLSISAVLSTFSSGLLAGALLTEAMVLVPFWRKLSPVEFLTRHSDMASLLFRFYAPLTVLGTSLPILTMLIALLFNDSSQVLWSASGILAVALLSIYFVYFKSANARFESGKLQDPELETELIRWAYWHNFRTGLACIGFLLSLLALARY